MVRNHHHRNVRLIALLLLSAMPAAAQELAQPLTGQPGDAARGKAVAVNSDLGNCLICHAIPIPEVPEGAAGDLGPSLAGVGGRMSAAELRQRIVDPKAINPDTIMPGYFVTEGLTRVQNQYEGRPVLTGQQIEDLVAYLMTLN